MRSGDYFVIEDSCDKQADLATFYSEATGQYWVDTKFTDFFGRNCTFAIDSVLVKQPPVRCPFSSVGLK